MPMNDASRERELIDTYPHPGDDPVARLRHVVDLFANTSDDEWVVLATSNLYGPGVRTGLTHGDLRVLLAHIEQKN